MADNVLLPVTGAGTSGISSRTEEKSAGVHTQVIALDIGGAGTESLLTTSLPVLTIGRWVDVTLSLDTNIYADGDVLADTQVVSAACRNNDESTHLRSVVAIDKDDQGYPFALFFFNSNVSLGTENSAPNISDANAAYYQGKVEVGTLDFDDLGGVRVAQVPCDTPLQPASGTDDVYMAVLSRGTGTYSASGVVIRLYFE